MLGDPDVEGEIGVAREVVLNYFTPDEQQLLRLVSIVVLPDYQHDALRTNYPGGTPNYTSAVYRADINAVEFYLAPLLADWANDPETRMSEIERILRHEFHHALGRNYDEYAPRDTGPMPDLWYRRGGPIQIELDDETVVLP